MKYLRSTQIMYLPIPEGSDADTVAHEHLVDDLPAWMTSRGIKWKFWEGDHRVVDHEPIDFEKPTRELPKQMTYQDLVDFAHHKGKTERDVLRYFAWVQVQSIKDMTDNELIEGILEGAYTLTVEDLCDDWEAEEQDVQATMIQSMLDWWNPGGKLP